MAGMRDICRGTGRNVSRLSHHADSGGRPLRGLDGGLTLFGRAWLRVNPPQHPGDARPPALSREVSIEQVKDRVDTNVDVLQGRGVLLLRFVQGLQ
jgi:hypothetical protein